MEKKDYLEQIANYKIDKRRIEAIQKLYKAELPDILKKIISRANETVFFNDGSRILSFDEIIDAKKDLHVDFKNKGIIPFADCGENDFIVYHFNDKMWSKFNIIDESIFKKKNTIEELLK